MMIFNKSWKWSDGKRIRRFKAGDNVPDECLKLAKAQGVASVAPNAKAPAEEKPKGKTPSG